MKKFKLLNKLLHPLRFKVNRFSPRINITLRRSLILNTLNINVIIDRGANAGIYGEELREYGYKNN